MKTLNEHNLDRRASELSKHMAGVACNTCNEELRYLELNRILTSIPPHQAVKCVNPDCKDFNKIKYKVV